MTTTCARCGGPLTPFRLCRDVTCPFSTRLQSDPGGWDGHPEPPSTGAPEPYDPVVYVAPEDAIAATREELPRPRGWWAVVHCDAGVLALAPTELLASAIANEIEAAETRELRRRCPMCLERYTDGEKEGTACVECEQHLALEEAACEDARRHQHADADEVYVEDDEP